MKKTSSLVQAAVVLWAAFLLAALAGCNTKPGSDVMATVDGRKIFRSDVDKYYDNNVASAQQPPSGEQATALRLNILHQMID
ncbi:MAG TPA: SurA N-terminal domain-containing protein, partial [Terriglobales bacterium]|nr:SurA N-terminal domain-containing protein [Terriglobales bacterium]